MRVVDFCIARDAAVDIKFVGEPVFEVRRTALVAASPREGVFLGWTAVLERGF